MERLDFASVMAELTEVVFFGDQNKAAVFRTEVLCLFMQLRYEKRDICEPLLLALGRYFADLG